MDSLGSEVGQKMRCAVKAKLIELGTGGSAGYIDDELPDYVMIMVANKRSKQQMISDLNLFLGEHTEVFVVWLHEVLQKLQEVTLPTTVVVKGKRKSGETTDGAVSTNKKDKKDKKKDKKLKKSNDKDEPDTPPPITPSITDVFATQLLEQNKISQQIDTSIVKTKKEETTITSTNLNSNQVDEFDIPTISEMTENQSFESLSREKDLQELAEIQKKIYQAKKQFKNLNSINDESEDEDFLNIKEDAEEFDDDVKKVVPLNRQQPKSPIIFNKTQENIDNTEYAKIDHRKRIQYPPIRPLHDDNDLLNFNSKSNESNNSQNNIIKKKSVHERLGIKIARRPENFTHSSDHGGRLESEFRLLKRRENEYNTDKNSYNRERRTDSPRGGERRMDSPRGGERRRDSPRGGERRMDSPRGERRRDSPRGERRRDLSKERREDSPVGEEERPQKRKLDSKVYVAHPKVLSKITVSENEEEFDETEDSTRHMNSVIKIKPRPRVSPSRQASKNLLLRAVAEAQKSTTVNSNLRPDKVNRNQTVTPNPIDNNRSCEQLFSKTFRNRNEILKRPPPQVQPDNIIIEVNSNKFCINNNDDTDDNDEYIPEPISDRGDSDNEFIYIPKTIQTENINNNEIETIDEYQPENHKTQFVVTLDEKSGEKYVSRNRMQKNLRDNRRVNSAGDKLKNYHVRNELSNNKKVNKIDELSKRKDKKSTNNLDHIQIYRKPREIQKLIIKNDTDEEEFHNDDDPLLNQPLHSNTEHKKENVNAITQEKSLEIEKAPIMKKKLPDKIISSSSDKNHISPKKRLRISVSPIKFDIKDIGNNNNDATNNDNYDGNNIQLEDNNKVSTRKSECVKKYDKIPELLSAVPINRVPSKTKDRCKFYPSCTNGECEFFHPSGPCKSFPNCKYADKCLYIHPKCKFDMTCTRSGCNFSHSVAVSSVVTAAPPLSSHVVPVVNYKTITANPLPAMCKFYPNCSNTVCTFYHPKICRFGKNCMNKVECNFYHHDISGGGGNNNKFKWIATG